MMLDKVKERSLRLWELYAALNPVRKVLALSVLAAAIALFVVVLLWANKTEYDTLYSGLSQDDAGAMVAKLKERKTPYELEANGTTIKIPRDLIQETRLFLATEGLPAGGAIGLELFNKSRLGETDFVQKLNFQRALQGELERTIMKFPEVQQVRVHLNIPKETLFIETAREPSASIVLKFHSGRSLSKNQLSGIVHLVASSVEGLKPERISIVDTRGGLLYSKEETDGSLLTASQIQHQRNLEQNLADRVTTMLERVVGPGKAIARVTAELNHQQINANEEIFDPDRTTIRSEQRLSERNQGPGRGAAGTPTAAYELGTGTRQQTGAAGQNEVYEKSEETTNYEITRINRQVLTPAGEIRRLSVAVILDGTYQEVEQAGKKVKTFVPLPQDQLAKMEDLVKKAVGFDEARGDSVVVTSVPIYLAEEAEAKWYRVPYDLLSQFGRPLFNIILIVLFFLFVVRPVLNWLRKETEPIPAPPPEAVALPAAEAAEGPALPEPPKPEKGRLNREAVLQLAKQNPDRTINLIRSWIDER
ncbi:MAG: flagellar basal-body MS-ring/collar protein FliF [Thermodesulfobacteriota bacterium]